jgi:2-dehydro-3-deoxyphosphooctonate aldolase (KDO 8-P synthase)
MQTVVKAFQIGHVQVGGRELFLIAGPCVVESETHAMKMAEDIGTITRRLQIHYIFKGMKG